MSCRCCWLYSFIVVVLNSPMSPQESNEITWKAPTHRLPPPRNAQEEEKQNLFTVFLLYQRVHHRQNISPSDSRQHGLIILNSCNRSKTSEDLETKFLFQRRVGWSQLALFGLGTICSRSLSQTGSVQDSYSPIDQLREQNNNRTCLVRHFSTIPGLNFYHKSHFQLSQAGFKLHLTSRKEI